MATLIFNDRGWTIATAAWSAGGTAHGMVICYAWGADGISWAQSATGIAQVKLPLAMDTFLKIIQGSSVADLRKFQ